MIERNARAEQRDANRKILSEVTRNKKEIVARHLDVIQRRHADIEEEISRLQDEKAKLLEHPVTNEEFLKAAQQKLRSAKQFAIDYVFKPHLEECRRTGQLPFNGPSMRVSVLPESKLWNLFAFAVTEEDLEVIIRDFPEIGMPEPERTSKIKAIDEKIAKLASGVRADLDRLRQGG